ncbi:MAG: hypothetical protein J7497_04930, partial [Chitinophagaceae bacterium]|nr:hypothetical protein [Chitinophagaceae bacterium]
RKVDTFPLGIKEAFTELMNIVPDGNKRAYYALSWFDENGKIIYIAAVKESYSGEGKIYNLDNYTINKGEYLAANIQDWMLKTDSIGKVFHDLMKEPGVDFTKPCVEWYKSDKEMMCLVKLK